MGGAFAGITVAQVFFFVVKVALIYAAYRLSEPESPLDTKKATDLRTSRRSGNEPWRIIYGEARVGGIYAFMHQGTNLYTTPPVVINSRGCLNLIMIMAAHQVQSIGTMYFDDEEVVLDVNGDVQSGDFAGLVHVEKRLGDHAATFTNLITETVADFPSGTDKWTVNHKLLGRAHVWIQLDITSDKFTGSIPNITFDIEGHNDVYDPRGPSNGYTQNAALCLADYVASDAYGIGGGYAGNIDEPALIAAANICNEDVVLDDLSTEDRYTCNGVLTCDDTRGENAGKILKAMGGIITYTEGLWRILPAAWRAPVLEFTEDDLVDSIKTIPRVSKREIFNAVKGLFVSAELNNIPTDYPPVVNGTYETEDGEQLFLELDQEMVQSPATAQRLGKIALERARQQITVIFPGKLVCYQAQVGEVVRLTLAKYGWSQKEFEVSESALKIEPGKEGGGPTIGCELTLRETAELVFDWADGEETAFDLAEDTYLPNPHGPAPPINMVLLSDDTTAIWITGETAMPAIKVTWDPPAAGADEPITRYELQWKVNVESTWSQTITIDPSMNEYAVEGVSNGILTDVRLRLVNIAGRASGWVLDNVIPSISDEGATGEQLIYGADMNDPKLWDLTPAPGAAASVIRPNSSAEWFAGGVDDGYIDQSQVWDDDLGTNATSDSVPSGSIYGEVWSFPTGAGVVTGRLQVMHGISGGSRRTDFQKVFYSTDGGTTWVQIGTSPTRKKQESSPEITVDMDAADLKFLAVTYSNTARTVAGLVHEVWFEESSAGPFAIIADNVMQLRGTPASVWAEGRRTFPGRTTDPDYVIASGQAFRFHLECAALSTPATGDAEVRLYDVANDTYYKVLTIPIASITTSVISESNVWTAPQVIYGPLQVQIRTDSGVVLYLDKAQANHGLRVWGFRVHDDEVNSNPDYRRGRRLGYPGGVQGAANKQSQVA